MSNDGRIIYLGFGSNTSIPITIDDIYRINPYAFENPNSAFYSCNTGTYKNDSLTQKWVNQVGGRTWAFVGKSDYANINQPSYKHLAIVASRKIHGFSYYGSVNYPVPGTTLTDSGEEPYMREFTPLY